MSDDDDDVGSESRENVEYKRGYEDGSKGKPRMRFNNDYIRGYRDGLKSRNQSTALED